MPGVTTKTLYIPRMADHALGVAAAMRHHGVRAEVLPPPDAETMAIGLDLCRGRECLPCLLCTGDIVRRARQPGFDAAASLFFMPTGPGPCRFGQYRYLEQDILDRLGLGAMEVLSPSSGDSYALFGDDPGGLRRLVVQAIVACDLLAKLLHEHRPYATCAADAERAYARSLDDVTEATEAGGGPALVDSMERAAVRFGRLEVHGRGRRPLVGIVGELYVMLNVYSNGGLVRGIEAAGGEVLVSTFMDWLHFTAWTRRQRAWIFGDPRELVDALAVGLVQDGIERRLHRAASSALRHPPESPVPKIMAGLREHYEPALGTEAVITMARALDMAGAGVAGIVNVLPFSCMPGIVVAAMAPTLRARHANVPWLDLSFDGQEQTNVDTRLEAFMHQATQFAAARRERGSAPALRWLDRWMTPVPGRA